MRASMCDRTQREPLPYLRYMLSSQVRSASPNSLFSRWACGDSVLGIRVALTASRGGIWSARSRSAWRIKSTNQLIEQVRSFPTVFHQPYQLVLHFAFGLFHPAARQG